MQSHDNNSLPGAILLAHGSREPEALAEIRELRDHLSAMRPGWLFEAAFLNQEPRLDQAVESLFSQGCRSIRILPLLVFKGRHLLEDLPNQIDALLSRHSGLAIDLAPHLSRLPGFGESLLRTLENTIPRNNET